MLEIKSGEKLDLVVVAVVWRRDLLKNSKGVRRPVLTGPTLGPPNFDLALFTSTQTTFNVGHTGIRAIEMTFV